MQKTVAVWLAALLVSLVAPASAGDSAPAKWRFDNPFCGVLAELVPNANAPGTEYGVQLLSDHGTKISAHVTLVGPDAAYDANVASTNLQGAPDDRRSEPAIVRFEKPVHVRYFFVDSYAIDAAAPVTCPSYVFPTGYGQDDDDSMPAPGLTTIVPSVIQPLPDLSCGKAYEGPSVMKGLDPTVGFYGYTERTTKFRVYIDSTGRPVRWNITQTSGVEGLDAAAMAGVQWTTYHPATFLCTPVVSSMIMDFTYKPT